MYIHEQPDWPRLHWDREAVVDALADVRHTSKWAKLAKCSQDTALRDITYLVDHGVLARNPGGGRSTSYELADQAQPVMPCS